MVEMYVAKDILLSLIGLLFIFLAFITAIISLIYGIRLHMYLKKYRPDILKWLIDKNGIFYIKYLPDWMNGNPWKRLWFFFFRWKKEESRLNRYKLISLITFISTLIMLVISYHIIKK